MRATQLELVYCSRACAHGRMNPQALAELVDAGQEGWVRLLMVMSEGPRCAADALCCHGGGLVAARLTASRAQV